MAAQGDLVRHGRRKVQRRAEPQLRRHRRIQRLDRLDADRVAASRAAIAGRRVRDVGVRAARGLRVIALRPSHQAEPAGVRLASASATCVDENGRPRRRSHHGSSHGSPATRSPSMRSSAAPKPASMPRMSRSGVNVPAMAAVQIGSSGSRHRASIVGPLGASTVQPTPASVHGWRLNVAAIGRLVEARPDPARHVGAGDGHRRRRACMRAAIVGRVGEGEVQSPARRHRASEGMPRARSRAQASTRPRRP